MGRLNNFDGLRMIAALAVIVSHQFTLMGRPAPEPIPGVPLGTLAVMVFFSISGYLISASWRHDSNLPRFLARRALRVAPGYLVAVGTVSALMWAMSLPEGFTMNPVETVNGSLWTIPLEVACYLVLAGCMIVQKRGALLMCLVALAASRYQMGWLVSFGLFFIAGALVDQFPRLRTSAGLAAMAAAGGFLLWELSVPYFGLSLIVTAASLWIGLRAWPVLRDVGKRGDLSYGVYLYAFPVQQLWVMADPEAGYPLLLAGSALCTLGLAWLSWRYVESPALRFKPQTVKVRTSAAPVHPVCPVTVSTVVQVDASSDH